MSFYAIDGIRPVVSKTAYVHPTATVIGDVIIGAHCYVGPSAVLRGDFGRLILEQGSNLQDTCVMHGFPDSDTVVEKDGHIGHGAVLHGCVVKENAMVGMNAVIMDGAVIGVNSIVAALSFVKADMKVPPDSLVLGSPARVIRILREEEMHWKRQGTAAYQKLTERALDSLQEVVPLKTMEADRQRFQFDDLKPLSEIKFKTED